MIEHRRLLLAVVAALGLLAIAACDPASRAPRWTCQTDAAVASKFHKERKCYRIAEFCEGGCEPVRTAQCFETSISVGGLGATDFPDRMCYATTEGCASARQRRLDNRQRVESGCHPASS